MGEDRNVVSVLFELRSGLVESCVAESDISSFPRFDKNWAWLAEGRTVANNTWKVLAPPGDASISCNRIALRYVMSRLLVVLRKVSRAADKITTVAPYGV